MHGTTELPAPREGGIEAGGLSRTHFQTRDLLIEHLLNVTAQLIQHLAQSRLLGGFHFLQPVKQIRHNAFAGKILDAKPVKLILCRHGSKIGFCLRPDPNDL